MKERNTGEMREKEGENHENILLSEKINVFLKKYILVILFLKCVHRYIQIWSLFYVDQLCVHTWLYFSLDDIATNTKVENADFTLPATINCK